jgi:hypothetical protein
MKKKCFSLVFLALVLSVFICAGSEAFAQEKENGNTGQAEAGLQVSPVRFVWDLNPKEERGGTINLKNYSDIPYDVDVEIEDFYVTDDSYEARFFVPDDKHQLKAFDVINWFEVPRKLTLDPGESRNVSFKVTVPDKTPTGGYYGAIFFKTTNNPKNEDDGETSKVIVHQRVGVLMVMAVNGEQQIRRSGEIIKFEPKKKIFWDNPAELVAEVTNSGNLHFKASGKLEITNFGRTVKTEDIPEKILYPERFRGYNNKWEFSPWAYGHYKAKISFVSDDQQIKMSKETSFYVIPWKTTALIIIALVLLYIFYRAVGSKFEVKRKKSK